MGSKKQTLKKAAIYALTGTMVLQSSFFVSAAVGLAEESEAEQLQELLELTSPEFETGEDQAASARLKIGDWLDYGSYGIERTDIPGTTYLFYITTRDENDEVINDEQLAYCIQSYFLTPLPGDHTVDMTDHILSVNGGKTVHKALYYGFGGAGYDAEAFETFLQEADPEYYQNVYVYLSDNEKNELAYILTHAAASYAYFTDGTDFRRFLELQFEIRYGEGWEKELENFIQTDVAKAEAAAGDLNWFGSTYGMNTTGINLAKDWYEILSEKKEPDLSVTLEDGIYTFNGNEKNEELKLNFAVPENWVCTIIEEAGAAADGELVTVYPSDRFSFVYAGETVSEEEGGISDVDAVINGTLTGAENEIWSLVILETNKGTNATVSKRQQDIAAVSRINEGTTEIGFTVEAQIDAFSLHVTDNKGRPVEGAVFEVFYDAEGSIPMQDQGEPVVMTTDEAGDAYLEYVINQKMEEHGGQLYVKQETAPTGFVADTEMYGIAGGEAVEITNELEAIDLGGSVKWNVPEGTSLPDSVTVHLQKNSEPVDTKTVTAQDDWSYAWEDLQKYDTDEAEECVYTIMPDPVDGYEAVVDGTDIINTITGTTALEGQIIWYDHEDADGIRPEQVTITVSCAGEEIAKAEIDEAQEWKYQFADLDLYSSDGSQKYDYEIGIQAPEAYRITIEDGQITATHVASAAVQIEAAAKTTGRDGKAGDFLFELVQVTEAAGQEEAADGVKVSAKSDENGKAILEVPVAEAGTSYYKITGTAADDQLEAESVTYIAQVDAAAGGEHGDQLETEVKYLDLDGNEIDPEELVLSAVYHASGTLALDNVFVVLENGELQEGQFEFQLKDADDKVLQTAANDTDGRVAFEGLEYTEQDIGKEYVYTICQSEQAEDGITYDANAYTITVKIADGEKSDGILQITYEPEQLIFTNTAAEKLTEGQSESMGEEEAAAAAAARAKESTWKRPAILIIGILLVVGVILVLERRIFGKRED